MRAHIKNRRAIYALWTVSPESTIWVVLIGVLWAVDALLMLVLIPLGNI